ncbi:MAG: S8 family serine peptidase, partial [Flavobacteriales bacterium]
FGLEEDYIFGFYSALDVEVDKLLNDYEYYAILFSSGNDRNEIGGNIIGPSGTRYPKDCASGYDCLAWSHNAKNIIVVGAIDETLVFEKPSDITLAYFSSVGPTDDGRIKPDVVAVGTNVTSTLMPDKYSSGRVGTSYSSPVVAGGNLLIQEHANNVLGNTLLGFTLKGLISNTAGELGDHIGPDYHYGWGLFDAKGAIDFISNINTSTFIAEDVLSNNETKTYYFAPKLDRITATLSWYDPEGTPVYDWTYELSNTEAKDLLLNNRTPMLVNDLDLRLENGSTTYEPWKLDVSQPSNPPFRGDNTVDNIEEVYIHTDELKESIIKVTVSHKGTLKDNLDEHFALLVNGVQEVTCNIYDGTSWSIKVPDGTDECLIFDGNYTVSTDTTLIAPYVQIEKGKTLTIDNKSTLTIDGALSNNGSLIVKPLATLKVK